MNVAELDRAHELLKGLRALDAALLAFGRMKVEIVEDARVKAAVDHLALSAHQELCLHMREAGLEWFAARRADLVDQLRALGVETEEPADG